MVFAARWKVRWTWGKFLVVASWVVVGSLAFYWGRCNWLAQAAAQAPLLTSPAPIPPPAPVPSPPMAGMSDYATQPVAYIYGTIPITRADLGEYLIARFGADWLDLLINHRIIDHVCAEKGIQVTAAEVEAALNEDLKGLNVNKVDFVKRVLKHYNKTLYEWKEDVIRPRLQLGKLAGEHVTVTDQDLRNAFEAKYGEKVKCRIIVWPREEKNRVMAMYNKLRDDDGEFERAAKMQFTPRLASAAGMIDPIGHHTMGDDPQSQEIERAIFALSRPGDITPLMETPEGVVIFKYYGRVEPDKTKRLEDVQPQLEAELKEKKVQAAITQVFAEYRKAADPKRLLAGYKTSAEIEKDVETELAQPEVRHNAKPTPPQGN